MTQSSLKLILARVAWSLIAIGLAPYAYLVLWPLAHNLEPLSVQVSLKRGEYTSPYFTTDLDDAYQVDLSWPQSPDPQTEVDLDWRIVDIDGSVIQQGNYNNRMGRANVVGLGVYRPKRGLRQRIIVNIHHDVQGTDGNPRLQIEVPGCRLT